MHNEISDYLRMIDDADNAHSPTSRAAYADALIDVLRDIFTDEEIQALAQAKAEGRLVVLPCKVGDDVTIIFNDSGEEFITTGWILEKIIITEDDALCSFYCSITSEYEERSVVAFNKTVFLTKEEAEKALEGSE